MEQDQLLLEPLLLENTVDRRALLPLWIKIFVWIFMITGIVAFLSFIVILLASFSNATINFEVALYGLESNNLLSQVGIFLFLLFMLKGIVAFGLWTKKDWAINLGITDAILGIFICSVVMIVLPFMNQQAGFTFTFRLELLLLIPFLTKLQKIKTAWRLG